jgi:hypothetical protein
MISFLVLVTILAAAALLVSWVAARPHGAQLRALANIAEGFQPARLTYRADAVIATRNLVGKIGSDAAHVAVCGDADIPLGMITDQAPAIDDGVSVTLFGPNNECCLGIASAQILAGAFVVPAANGKLRTLPAAAGTYWIVGRALKTAAADNDDVEFIPCFPIQRVVSG